MSAAVSSSTKLIFNNLICGVHNMMSVLIENYVHLYFSLFIINHHDIICGLTKEPVC